MLKSLLLQNTRDIYNCNIDSVLEGWRRTSNPLCLMYSDMGEVYDNTEVVNEDTKSELLSKAEYKRKQRAKTITLKYGGVLNTKGWVVYRTPSQTGYTVGGGNTKHKLRTKEYIQYIKLEDMKSYDKSKSERDIIRNMLLKGNIKIYCNCPDFLYAGYKFMAYKNGYGMFKELRPPNKRNPKQSGSVCKHCIAVLSHMGLHWTSIAKDMKKTSYWKKRYYKEGLIKKSQSI